MQDPSSGARPQLQVYVVKRPQTLPDKVSKNPGRFPQMGWNAGDLKERNDKNVVEMGVR